MVEVTTSYAKGVEAEKRAAAWFKKAGYKILQERYKTKFGEIDLIVERRGVLAFVEVKGHQAKDSSLYAVTPRTQQRIAQSALWFIHMFPEYNDYAMRFDVVVVGEQNIEHLDNAWMLES